MEKIRVLTYVIILFLLVGCELPSGRGPTFGKAELVSLKSDINPVYVLTKKGLTVIDSKTDTIVTQGYVFKYVDTSEISAFYNNELFTASSGSDFPKTKANTYLWYLASGRYRYIFDAPIYALKQQGDYIYGLASPQGEGLNLIYNPKTDKFIKGVPKTKEPMDLLGFASLPRKEKSLLIRNIGGIQLRSLDAKTIVFTKKVANIAGLVADDTKVILFGRGDVKVIDLLSNRLQKLPIKVPDLYIAFYAYGKLFIGIAPGYENLDSLDEEEIDDYNGMPRTTHYSIYRLSDGKLIKKMVMDLQQNNVLKVNNLLIFLDGKQKGKALNLKTAKIEDAIVISPRSIVQDGKIYSVSENKVVVRQKIKTLKIIKLDSQHIDKFKDNTSIFNPAIFTSIISDDNFKIIEQ